MLSPDPAGALPSGPSALHTRPGWDARLQLGFTRAVHKTVLSERHHQGPLTVQRPFYADDGLCHVYLLHPPGGMVAGDSLAIDVTLAAGSEALLTTPAAGKCYRSSDARVARQAVTLTVADRAALEWLPQETIVYDGARLEADMRIELGDAASFIAWDIAVFGRPAAGEVFEHGFVQAGWRIYKAGRPLHTERMRFDAAAVQARWGLQGCPVCGSLFAAPVSEQALARVRALIGEAPGRGVTLIDDMLVCRAIDQRADRLRAFLQTVWAVLRPDVLQRSESPPRIWAY